MDKSGLNCNHAVLSHNPATFWKGKQMLFLSSSHRKSGSERLKSLTRHRSENRDGYDWKKLETYE